MFSALAEEIQLRVNAAGEPALEQIEETLGAMSARGLSLRSAPCNQRDPAGPNVQAGLIILNKAEASSTIEVSTLQGLYPALNFVAVNARTGAGVEDSALIRYRIRWSVRSRWRSRIGAHIPVSRIERACVRT